jgi:hypothetical protein
MIKRERKTDGTIHWNELTKKEERESGREKQKGIKDTEKRKETTTFRNKHDVTVNIYSVLERCVNLNLYIVRYLN